MRSKLLAAVAACSFILGSSAAVAQVAQPAPATTAATARAAAPVTESNDLRGAGRWILAAIAAGLIIWGAIELFGNDDDEPVSP